MSPAFHITIVVLCSGVHGLQVRSAEGPQDGLINKNESQVGTCTLATMRDAEIAWLFGRYEELEDNPCVDKTEVLLQKLDQFALESSRKYFDMWHGFGTSGGAIKCKKTLLPSAVYLGQGHTGSTTLAMQLDAHPELSYGVVKEHHWGEEVFSGNGHLAEYTGQFRVPCETRVSMDFSPGEYLDGHHGSHWRKWQNHLESQAKWFPWTRTENENATVKPEIVRQTLGNGTKLIVMLRDPLEFLDSLPKWWRDHVKSVHGDCYSLGVEKWLEVFPKEQILFIETERYFRSPQKTLDRIFEFLGVSAWTYPEEIPHAGRRRQGHNISDSERRSYFSKPHNRRCKDRLEELTSMRFHWPGSE